MFRGNFGAGRPDRFGRPGQPMTEITPQARGKMIT